jgi:tripartite-type tricarboxylate transporter receptor subunit TctC
MIKVHQCVCVVAASMLAATVLVRPAVAQTYPSKPVRFIIANSPGGSDDFHGRLMTQKLSELLGQQFVADNRSGAGGLIGQGAVANATPDGHTILLAGRSLTAARHLRANMPFDPQRAFAPIAQFASYPLVLVVHPGMKAGGIGEFVSLARAQPGRINFAAGAGGGMTYIAPLIFMSMARVELTYVPYKNLSQAYTDTVGGQIGSCFMTIAPAIPLIESGKLRALGVTGATRSPALPEVPTIADSGVPGYEAGSWLYLLAPARTPRAVIDTLSGATQRIIAMPDVRERLLKAGSEPEYSSPEQLAKRIAAAVDQFAGIAKSLDLKPQ